MLKCDFNIKLQKQLYILKLSINIKVLFTVCSSPKWLVLAAKYHARQKIIHISVKTGNILIKNKFLEADHLLLLYPEKILLNLGVAHAGSLFLPS